MQPTDPTQPTPFTPPQTPPTPPVQPQFTPAPEQTPAAPAPFGPAPVAAPVAPVTPVTPAPAPFAAPAPAPTPAPVIEPVASPFGPAPTAPAAPVAPQPVASPFGAPAATPQFGPAPLATPTPAPGFAPAQPVADYGAGPALPVDPGKTLGIVGLILAAFFQLLGLILSIISFKKSKAAGFSGKLGKIGIIVNAVVMVLGTIAAIVLLAVSASIAAPEINKLSAAANSQAVAMDVVKKIEAYNALNDSGYPTTLSALDSSETTALDSTTVVADEEITSEPEDAANTVEISTCGADGNKIGYWAGTMTMYMYTGSADSFSDCTLMTS